MGLYPTLQGLEASPASTHFISQLPWSPTALPCGFILIWQTRKLQCRDQITCPRSPRAQSQPEWIECKSASTLGWDLYWLRDPKQMPATSSFLFPWFRQPRIGVSSAKVGATPGDESPVADRPVGCRRKNKGWVKVGGGRAYCLCNPSPSPPQIKSNASDRIGTRETVVRWFKARALKALASYSYRRGNLGRTVWIAIPDRATLLPPGGAVPKV